MKIVSSSIQMGASTSLLKSKASIVSFQATSGSNQGSNTNNFPGVTVELSENGLVMSENIQQTAKPEEVHYELTDEERGKIKLLSDFIYLLTGKRMKFYVPKLHKTSQNPVANIQSSFVLTGNRGWRISFQAAEFTHEEEHLSFESNGVIKTEDGREIQIDLKLNMSRSFTSSSMLSFNAGTAPVDPLVINFDGAGVSLGSKSYEFDLNFDGVTDNIAFVGPGSGFLALDKNANGTIDDGSELFGPSTGDGFLELSAYDQDQNGWIDENDPIYNNLSIWVREDNGEPKLFALGQVGIGAIYLGNVKSPFSLVDNSNQQLGQIRKTGIFLFESGRAGTIQHVDLAI